MNIVPAGFIIRILRIWPEYRPEKIYQHKITVVIKDDEIISEAEEAVKTKNDISCHAEMEAIRQAVKILNTNDLSACLYLPHMSLVLCVRMQ